MANDLVQMSDQFQGLPIDSLIGGPLAAACDSQLKLAYATADFIKVIGFMPPGKGDEDKGFGAPRTAKFTFNRPVEILITDSNGKSGNSNPVRTIQEEQVELEVPLLAIVNVPNLSITTVDVTFDMEVKSSFSTTKKEDSEAGFAGEAKVGWGIFSAKVSVHGKVSSHSETTRKSDNSAKYHISVHAEDRGMPEGMARVMDILQSSIAPRSIGTRTPTKDDKKVENAKSKETS